MGFQFVMKNVVAISVLGRHLCNSRNRWLSLPLSLSLSLSLSLFQLLAARFIRYVMNLWSEKPAIASLFRVIWIRKLSASFTDRVALAMSFHRCAVEHFVSLSLWLSVKLNKVDARCSCVKRMTRQTICVHDARCYPLGGPANAVFRCW